MGYYMEGAIKYHKQMRNIIINPVNVIWYFVRLEMWLRFVEINVKVEKKSGVANVMMRCPLFSTWVISFFHNEY